MSKFHELAEFERDFPKMGLAELQRWHSFWLSYAQQLSPKARRWVMKKVYVVEKAIQRRGGMDEALVGASAEKKPPPGTISAHPTKKAKALAGRIMYIECKAGDLTGPARIGRVTHSQTGRTLYYHGRRFRSLKGAGFKSNYYDVDTGEDYWISGPKRDGGDRLYRSNLPVEIDDDVREEYWREIRRQPPRINECTA